MKGVLSSTHFSVNFSRVIGSSNLFILLQKCSISLGWTRYFKTFEADMFLNNFSCFTSWQVDIKQICSLTNLHGTDLLIDKFTWNRFAHWQIYLEQMLHQCRFISCLYFFKWAIPGLFFVYFRSFQTNFTIFTTNKCEKCPSSIRRRESNPQPLERESLPITTRWLPPSAYLKVILRKSKIPTPLCLNFKF